MYSRLRVRSSIDGAAGDRYIRHSVYVCIWMDTYVYTCLLHSSRGSSAGGVDAIVRGRHASNVVRTYDVLCMPDGGCEGVVVGGHEWRGNWQGFG